MTSIANQQQQDVNELRILIDSYNNQKSSNFDNFLVKNCTEKHEIFNFFNFSEISSELKQNVDVVCVKFKIGEIFLDFHTSDLNIIAKKWSNKGFVVVLENENCSKIAIYWKSKELQHFKRLKSRYVRHQSDYEMLYGYAAQFLVATIKSNELGFINRLSLQSTITDIDLDFLIDSRGFNLLLIAADEGNASIVKILINLGMSTNIPRNNIDAQSLAWNGRHFDVIYVLAEYNLPYPKEIEFSQCSGDLKELYNKTEELHESILSKDSEKVEEILNLYPKFYHFYNSENESALKIALQSDSIEIYELLLSQKFRFGPHENPEEYLENLNDDSKRLIEIIHNKYSIILQEKHINILIENSFICHDETDAQKKAEYVQRAYRTLNSLPLIRIILMVVAASKKFKIIFDFNREAVNVLDPTTTPYTQGIFYISGRIYIGAKQLLDNDTANITLATMAHELCHFAMNIIYDNCAKPYKVEDKKTMDEFEDVSDACMVHYGKEDVVDSVYNDYPDEFTHAELIVRVVHMLALYRDEPENLKEVQEIFFRLFDFYEKKIVPELKDAVKDMENKEIMELEIKDKLIVKYKWLIVIISILAVIGIIAVGLIVRYVFFPDFFVFRELEKVDQDRVKNSPVTYKGINVTFADIFADDSEAYDKLSSDDIAHMLKGCTLNFNNSLYQYLNDLVIHDWKNMTKKLRYKVYDSKFNFQNVTLQLGRLKSISPKIFESMTSDQFVQVFEGQMLNISSMFQNFTKFYIERKFVCMYRCVDRKELTLDDIIQEAEDSKLFLLSSGIGSGKTEVFKQFTVRIKQNNPLRWVTYVDLERFKRLFYDNRILNDIEGFLQLIVELNQKDKFEMKMFKSFYMSDCVNMGWI